jgi:predicted TIM-barrel fold metal-dependent hydrolase
MKVVDVHVHVLKEEWWPEEVWRMLSIQLTSHVIGSRGTPPDPAAFRAATFPKFWDPEGEHRLKLMDECGIDMTMLVSDDFGVTFREPAVTILEQNKAIADLAAKHPTRFKAFCVVDPRRKDGMAILERCIKEYGMFGVGECHPDAGWSPLSPEAYRMYERLQEWRIPMLTHTGLFFPPFHSRLAHPLLLDDVCSDFPELTVIAAHSGRQLWWKTAAHLARVHPNLYGELAGFQTVAFTDFPQFCAILRSFIDTAGAHKLVWATDDPVYNAMGISTKRYIDLIRGLPDKSAPGIGFTREEVDLILGGNAQRALKL